MEKPEPEEAGVSALAPAAAAPIVRRSPRSKASGSRASYKEPSLVSHAAPTVHAMITVGLESAKAPGARVPSIMKALAYLIPGFRRTATLYKNKFNDAATLGEARKALEALTESPAVQQLAATSELHVVEFLAAVLDWVQDSAEMPGVPRASQVGLAQHESELDVSLKKLQEIGLFPDKWRLPLTAEGIKQQNRRVPAAVAAAAVATAPGALPVRSRKTHKGEHMSLVEKPLFAPATGAAAAPATMEIGPVGSGASRRGSSRPSSQPASQPNSRPGSAAAGGLTFTYSIKNRRETQLGHLLNGLKGLLPQAASQISTLKAFARTPRLMKQKVVELLGDEVPPLDDMGKGQLYAAHYIQRLLTWAVEAAGGANAAQVGAEAVVVAGDTATLVPEVWQRAGLQLELWEMPLTAENIRATSRPPVAAADVDTATAMEVEETAAPPAAAVPVPPAEMLPAEFLPEESPAAHSPAAAPAAPAGEEGVRATSDIHATATAAPSGARAAQATDQPLVGLTAAVPLALPQEKRPHAVVPAPMEPSANGRWPRKPAAAKRVSPSSFSERSDDILPDVSGGAHQEEKEEGEAAPLPERKRAKVAAPSAAPRSPAPPRPPSVTEALPSLVEGCYWLGRTGRKAEHWRCTWNLPKGARQDDCISCHDCQSQHLVNRCQHGECNKSFCMKCCRHYDYLHRALPGDPLYPLLQDFKQGKCPCCMNICCRKDCLRKVRNSGELGAPVPKLPPLERRVMAIHMAASLEECAQSLQAMGEKEAARQGVAMENIVEENIDGARILCNRCATCIENVHVHCESCEADICPACCAYLADGRPGSLECPMGDCGAKTVLKRLLPMSIISRLSRVEADLDALEVRGGAAEVAYDFDCMLWHLPTEADSRRAAEVAQGAAAAMAGPSRKGRSRREMLKATRHVAAGGGAQPPQLASGGPSTSAEPAPGSISALQLQPALLDAMLPALSEFFKIPAAAQASADGKIVLQSVLDAILHESISLNPQIPQAAQLIQAMQAIFANPPPPQPLSLFPNGNGHHPQLLLQPTALEQLLPPRALTPTPDCIDLKTWHKNLPPEDYRLAARRPDGVQNYIWTPHVRDFASGSPRRAETVERFVQRWRAGEAIIIRGFRGKMNWRPDIVTRAARDMKTGETDLQVINCSDWVTECTESVGKFFKGYKACYGPTVGADGAALPMLKLKDFPPNDSFSNKCKRHNDDFVEMLSACMPEYLHPLAGVLNMAAQLPPTVVPPDLGPKGYIAFGREEEHPGEGDSVTRLHEDLSDAVNIMCHVQLPPGTTKAPPARCGHEALALPSCGGAGALWDLFRRDDVPTLRRFLTDAVAGRIPGCPPFLYRNKPLTTERVIDVVHDQSFTLTAAHRAILAAPPYSVQPWTVEQYEWEGVLIPAACVHQVRNLRASIKIALDFVSPESVKHCLAQREERRRLVMEVEHLTLAPTDDPADLHFHDKLQVANMVVHSLSGALQVLLEEERAEAVAMEVEGVSGKAKGKEKQRG